MAEGFLDNILNATKLTEVPWLMTGNVLRKVKGVDWMSLGDKLKIPKPNLLDIQRRHTDSRGKMEALITQWLEVDPTPSWRRVICALDDMEEHQTADSIRDYAEPLTDPTLTLHTVTTAVAPVKNWGDLGAFLGVPQAKRSKIDSEYPTIEEKKEATLDYWLCNCPVVSWDKLAGALHFQEEKQSLQYIRRYLRITAEPTLTFPNLCQVLADVDDWFDLFLCLGLYCVPFRKMLEIESRYPDYVERKNQVLHNFLTSHPAPSWRVVFESLYVSEQVNFHTILREIRKRYGRDLPSSDLPICKEVDKQRSTSCAPLVVHFAVDPQYEAFCTLISFILSSDNCYPSPWELHHRPDGPATCLYRNCVKFTIPECAGSITLINSSAYFEVHISAPGPKLRYFIREAIFTGAAAVIMCEKIPGIICPCKAGDTHAATVQVDQKLWICKKNPEKWGKFQELQPSQKEWFESAGPEGHTPSSIYAQVAKNREKIIEFLSANVSPEGLANQLQIAGLINTDVVGKAAVTAIPVADRIRPVIKAVISKLELSEENAEKFKRVLNTLGVLEDLDQIIN